MVTAHFICTSVSHDSQTYSGRQETCWSPSWLLSSFAALGLIGVSVTMLSHLWGMVSICASLMFTPEKKSLCGCCWCEGSPHSWWYSMNRGVACTLFFKHVGHEFYSRIIVYLWLYICPMSGNVNSDQSSYDYFKHAVLPPLWLGSNLLHSKLYLGSWQCVSDMWTSSNLNRFE